MEGTEQEEVKPTVATPKQFDCPTCGQIFKSRTGLTYHREAVHEEIRYKCNTCKKLFSDKQNCIVHQHTHEDPLNRPTFNCDICSKTFLRKKDVTNHKRIHLGDAAKVNKCAECPKAFIRARDLKRHMLVHSKEMPYKCIYCSLPFQQSGDRIVHQRSCPIKFLPKSSPNYETLMCETCNFKFKTVDGLKSHCLRIHHTESQVKTETFKCEACHLSFKTQDRLNLHYKKIHSEDEQ